MVVESKRRKMTKRLLAVGISCQMFLVPPWVRPAVFFCVFDLHCCVPVWYVHEYSVCGTDWRKPPKEGDHMTWSEHPSRWLVFVFFFCTGTQSSISRNLPPFIAKIRNRYVLSCLSLGRAIRYDLERLMIAQRISIYRHPTLLRFNGNYLFVLSYFFSLCFHVTAHAFFLVFFCIFILFLFLSLRKMRSV